MHVFFVVSPNRFLIQKNLQTIQENQKTLQSVKIAPPVTGPSIGQNYAVLHPLYQQCKNGIVPDWNSRKDWLIATRWLLWITATCRRFLFQRYASFLLWSAAFFSVFALLVPSTAFTITVGSWDWGALSQWTSKVMNLCRVVMVPVKKGSDRFLVDSLFAGSTDVIVWKAEIKLQFADGDNQDSEFSFLSLYLECTRILFKIFIQHWRCCCDYWKSGRKTGQQTN